MQEQTFSEEFQKRFWSNVDQTPNGTGTTNGLGTDCWPWKRATNGRYGITHYNHKFMSAHRVAYALTHPNEDLSGLLVMHKCDNPVCCRPDHLFKGTDADNTWDKISKGRQAQGIKLSKAMNKAWENRRRTIGTVWSHVTKEAVLDIRAHYKPGRGGTTRTLAKKWGISITHVRNIAQGKYHK